MQDLKKLGEDLKKVKVLSELPELGKVSTIAERQSLKNVLSTTQAVMDAKGGGG